MYVGSLQERKRPELVIEVADKLRNYKFGIVGDGPLKNVLSTEIKNKNISNVELLGTLSQKDLGNIMRRSKNFFSQALMKVIHKVLVKQLLADCLLLLWKK